MNSYNLIETTIQNLSTVSTVAINGLSQTIIVPIGQTRVFHYYSNRIFFSTKFYRSGNQRVFGIFVNGSKNFN